MSDLIEQDGQYMNFTSEPWVILSPIEQSIKEKLEKYGTPLKDWDIEINYGIKTGCNEAFIINEAKRAELIRKDPKSAEIIRPILRGRDIKRYSYEFANLYLICTFPSKHYDIEQFPAVKDWLINGDWVLPKSPIGTGKLRLEQTGAEHIVGGIKFKSRKKTNNKWFETQDSINYWDDFSKPKLLYSEIVQEPHFYLDKNGEFYNEATSFLMTGNHLEYLQIMLHSKLMTFAFKHYYAGGGLGNTGFRYKKAFLEKLPIILPTKELEQELIFCSDKETMICKMYNLSNTEITLILQN